jgi:NH3-dependent NAD+ synthetase
MDSNEGLSAGGKSMSIVTLVSGGIDSSVMVLLAKLFLSHMMNEDTMGILDRGSYKGGGR